MNKIRLSYSTINTTLHAPHTYINRMLGLPTFTTADLESGKEAHKIISASLSGKTPHKLFADLPLFELVEEKDFDERLKIEFDFNDKYYIIGYADALNTDKTIVGEIKSGGKLWSVGEFIRLPQWKIYALGQPTIQKVWFVSVPKDRNLWMKETIRVYNTDITEKHKKEAEEFIEKGIKVIENIKDAVYEEMLTKEAKGYKGRSRWCFYSQCGYCEE